MRIASSTFGCPPPMIRYHRPLPLPYLSQSSVDYSPFCFPCKLAFPAQHGYLPRPARTPSPLLGFRCPPSLCSHRLVLPILLSFEVLIIKSCHARLHHKRVQCGCFCLLLYVCPMALVPHPYPARPPLLFVPLTIPCLCRSHCYLQL